MIVTAKSLRLAATGLSALWLLAQPALAEAPAKPAPSETLDQRRSFASGQDAWEKVCARCHTVEGKADAFSVGPDLSVNEYDADTLRFFMRNGHLAMPAFPGSAFDDASIDELAAYLKAHVYKGEAQ